MKEWAIVVVGFAIGVADDYIAQRPAGGPSSSGWDQVAISAKYQLWQNDLHEAIVSVGAEADPYAHLLEGQK